MEERKHSTLSLIVLMLTFSVYPLWPIVSVLTAIIILLFNLVLQFILKDFDDKIKYEKVQKYLYAYWRYFVSIFISCFLGYLISYLPCTFIDEHYPSNITLIYFTSLSIILLILAIFSLLRDKKRKFYIRTSKISIVLIIVLILLRFFFTLTM